MWKICTCGTCPRGGGGAVCLSVHPCECDNCSRTILIAFKLQKNVHEFDIDLSVTFMTLPIVSRSTLLVNAITAQGLFKSVSSFTVVLLGSKS